MLCPCGVGSCFGVVWFVAFWHSVVLCCFWRLWRSVGVVLKYCHVVVSSCGCVVRWLCCCVVVLSCGCIVLCCVDWRFFSDVLT